MQRQKIRTAPACTCGVETLQPLKAALRARDGRPSELDAVCFQGFNVAHPSGSGSGRIYLTSTVDKLLVWLIKSKNMRHVSAALDHGDYGADEAVVKIAPQHWDVLEVG